MCILLYQIPSELALLDCSSPLLGIFLLKKQMHFLKWWKRQDFALSIITINRHAGCSLWDTSIWGVPVPKCLNNQTRIHLLLNFSCLMLFIVVDAHFPIIWFTGCVFQRLAIFQRLLKLYISMANSWLYNIKDELKANGLFLCWWPIHANSWYSIKFSNNLSGFYAKVSETLPQSIYLQPWIYALIDNRFSQFRSSSYLSMASLIFFASSIPRVTTLGCFPSWLGNRTWAVRSS